MFEIIIVCLCAYICMHVLIHPNEINCKIFCSELEILLSKIDLSVFHKLFSKKNLIPIGYMGIVMRNAARCSGCKNYAGLHFNE